MVKSFVLLQRLCLLPLLPPVAGFVLSVPNVPLSQRLSNHHVALSTLSPLPSPSASPSTIIEMTSSSSSPTAATKSFGNRLSSSWLDVRILGVCGGIGSGKSTACQLLVKSSQLQEQQGEKEEEEQQQQQPIVFHLDADSLAHRVYAPGSQAVHDIVGVFGKSVLMASDGTSSQIDSNDLLTIDRKKLGAIVFADRSSMAQLERLVWPHVKTLLVQRIEEIVRQEEEKVKEGQDNNSGNKQKLQVVIILEAAVLLDAGWDDLLDGLWVVRASRPVAMTRLMEKRGLTQEESEKRIVAQQSRRGIGSNLQSEIDNRVVTGVIDNDGSLDDLTQKLQPALNNSSFWKRPV